MSDFDLGDLLGLAGSLIDALGDQGGRITRGRREPSTRAANALQAIMPLRLDRYARELADRCAHVIPDTDERNAAAIDTVHLALLLQANRKIDAQRLWKELCDDLTIEVAERFLVDLLRSSDLVSVEALPRLVVAWAGAAATVGRSPACMGDVPAAPQPRRRRRR